MQHASEQYVLDATMTPNRIIEEKHIKQVPAALIAAQAKPALVYNRAPDNRPTARRANTIAKAEGEASRICRVRMENRWRCRWGGGRIAHVRSHVCGPVAVVQSSISQWCAQGWTARGSVFSERVTS